MRFGRGLFARTFALTALVLLIFSFVVFALNALVMRQWGDSARLRPPDGPMPFHAQGEAEPGRDFGEPPPGFPRVGPGGPHDHPSVLTARIIGASPAKDRPKVLREIERTDSMSGAHYRLIDADGKVVGPPGGSLPFEWGTVPLPTREYDFEPLDRGDSLTARTLVRLSGEPVQYLYVELQRPKGLPLKIPLFIFGSHVLAILLGAWVSLLILFRYLRRNMHRVDEVLEDLRGGDLKARLPSDGPEEIRGTADRFNRMIDEIERLVGHLREVESSRMKLMQELAHDLRTPVASLRNLLETVQRKDDVLEAALRRELLSLASNEIEYFERLVEDLLMLAQINEPNYRAARQEVVLNDLLNEAGDLAAPMMGPEGKNIRLEREIPEGAVSVYGDIHLLRRLMRNALDNAFSSAKSCVWLKLIPGEAGMVRILVEDDGPGFPSEALPLFGEKKTGRSRSRSKDGALRAGLGAVIMKNITRIHGGALQAKNRLDASGVVVGASIEILLAK